ncbi:putative peptidoglycan glycosyltransferase FtsW [Lachnospiraceae bacterium]|nr:FtsW/RodA/SpoVE family cell cycle protein [Acetatifactor sp.]GFH95745.1 putative peptidoglycan glycosyltransferase FtsW [Lachnospiraceae bacterium]
MFNKGYRIRNYDFKLILLILLLSTVGVLAVGSAQQSVQQKQLLGVIMGTFLMVVISLLDYTVLLKLYWLMYLGNLVLLLLVRYLGYETKGAQRWFQIPGGFRFQPSETAKILLILFFAQFIMKHIEKLNTFRIIALCVALMAAPWYLIYKQPDLSTSIVMLALFCIIMFAGGLSFKVIFGVVAVAVPALALLVALALQPDSTVLTNNQRGRILAFIYPEQYATTTAYQQLNSVTAIASGMLDGKGYKNNEITSVKNGNFISEAQTDFIFAVIGEEFGFKGSLVVILLEMLIALECIHVARRARDPAGTIIAAGMGGLVGVQSFINIGVATFILPTTGLTLPFVSYGLTSLMSLFIGMGFVLNVRLQARR